MSGDEKEGKKETPRQVPDNEAKITTAWAQPKHMVAGLLIGPL